MVLRVWLRSQKIARTSAIDCMSKCRATSSTISAGARTLVSRRSRTSGSGLKRSKEAVIEAPREKSR